MSSFEISELNRRLANIVRLGKIDEFEGQMASVRIGEVKTAKLPILSVAGDTNVWIPLTKDEQVMVICPYGEMSQGVILRSIHYNIFQKPTNKDTENFLQFKDGSYISYDPQDKVLNINNKDGEFKALFKECLLEMLKDGLNLKFGADSLLSMHNDHIKIQKGKSQIWISDDCVEITNGSAMLSVDSNGIGLQNGSSNIDLSSNNISISSINVDISPPICKCGAY